MQIEIDPAAGMARMSEGHWRMQVPLADLPRWLAFSRRLWSRGAKAAGQPGPWAAFHASAVAALEVAVKEAGLG